MVEKTMRMNYLFDFYQTLLTSRQREYMQMYYLEDYSLVEIANIADVSRQAVYDNIKRTESILESYEKQLLLYEKFQQRNQLLEELQDFSPQLKNSQQFLSIIKQIKQLG